MVVVCEYEICRKQIKRKKKDLGEKEILLVILETNTTTTDDRPYGKAKNLPSEYKLVCQLDQSSTSNAY
jgi:hypothetical protein